MLWRVGGEFGNAISVGGSTCSDLRAVKIFPLARATTYGPKRKRALFFYKKRADLALSR